MLLDNKNGGRPYDREIANQIYEKCNKNLQGETTMMEFVDVVFEAERILKEKI